MLLCFKVNLFCLPQLDKMKMWVHKIISPLLSRYPKPDTCHICMRPSKMNTDKHFRPFYSFFVLMNVFMTHQRLVFNLLSDEFVLTEGVACLSGDGVYGPLLHLLFDGTEQHEERLASALLCFGKEPRD